MCATSKSMSCAYFLSIIVQARRLLSGAGRTVEPGTAPSEETAACRRSSSDVNRDASSARRVVSGSLETCTAPSSEAVAASHHRRDGAAAGAAGATSRARTRLRNAAPPSESSESVSEISPGGRCIGYAS